MEIIEKLKGLFVDKRKLRVLSDTLQIFNLVSPQFSGHSGSMYSNDLIRSSIHTLAVHTSKLNPVILGKSYKSLEKILQTKPNTFMTTQQFLYRTRTIYENENNCYIIPIYEDNTAMKIVGLYPISTLGSELIKFNGKLYLKYRIGSETKAIEYEKIGHLKKHYYTSEYFGESNSAIDSTMDLLDTQNEGIINGVKQSATIRFLAQLSNTLKPEDVRAERKRLMEDNLSVENNGGVLLYDNKYKEIKQVESKPWVIDDKQTDQVKKNVFNYFGINESIIQNSYDENQWNSFYEGAIETFAIQLSQVITCMLYTEDDIKRGNRVIFESSRLQYASNVTKLQIATQLIDRALLTRNEAREIFNLAGVEDGDLFYIRKEYSEVSNLDKEGQVDGGQESTTTAEQVVEDTGETAKEDNIE